MQPTGTATIGGVEYTYMEFDQADANGLTYNLIINNNNGGTQTPDINITFGDQVDFFYSVTGTGNPATQVVIEDPFAFTPSTDPGTGDEGGEGEGGEGEGGEGTDPEPTGKSVSFYIADNTGWDLIQLYSWGGTPNVEAFGGWPGASVAETITCAGTEYKIFIPSFKILTHNDCGFKFKISIFYKKT